VRLVVLLFIGVAVIMSVPKWRKRLLGRYAAILIALGWLVAIGLILLR
jgi:hypothetical protein